MLALRNLARSSLENAEPQLQKVLTGVSRQPSKCIIDWSCRPHQRKELARLHAQIHHAARTSAVPMINLGEVSSFNQVIIRFDL
jgi:hypothetical protein